MPDVKVKLKWSERRRSALLVGLAWVCLIGVASARAQVADSTPEMLPTTRLLSVEEGRAIVSAAWEQELPARGTQDCSHLAHQIYLKAGFEYPYASSFELYAGNENFARVRLPHAGDLIVWPGHVGIVVNPLQHRFYSLVRTGLEAQDYEAPYWKLRGTPRFYRYRVQNAGVLSAAKTPSSPQISNSDRQHSVGQVIEERSSEENPTLSLPSKTASERTAAIYGPRAAAELAQAAPKFEIPSSIIIAAGGEPPTREEVAEGISELSNAVGSVLRSDFPLKAEWPVVIVEQFSVERVEIKRDHGWARLRIDSKVCLDGGATQLKRRQEKVRWELRRTKSGWEAVTPANRVYVPHDVAVKNLAAQLARLTESDGAAAHQETALRLESELAKMLSALLEGK